MQTKCPHCEKPIAPSAILCMNCGSYVVKMDEKQRRWHLYAIPVFIAAVAIGLAFYMQAKDDEVKAQRQKAIAEQDRTLDPARERQMKQDEAERQRLVSRRKKLEEEKRLRAEERKAMEEWRTLPTKDKVAYLEGLLTGVRSRIASLQQQAQTEATEELRLWLTKLDSRLAAAVTFLEAGQYDQAKGLLEGIHKELADMLGEGDETEDAEETAPEAPAPEGS